MSLQTLSGKREKTKNSSIGLIIMSFEIFFGTSNNDFNSNAKKHNKQQTIGDSLYINSSQLKLQNVDLYTHQFW
jgi:hypothetical protein